MSLKQITNRNKSRGFTLVEMMIIAPVALLVITGFIALMVTMVGNVIASHQRNVMTHDIQNALNMIEQDVRLSTEFLTSTGTMLSPQGKDNATAPFLSTSDDLILGEIATDKNPIDPTRGFVYYDAPNSCSDPAEVYKNRIFFTTVVYFVKGGSLWRRSYVPNPSGTLCKQAWQVNSCAPGYSASATRCKTNDSEVMQNVSSFTIGYYANPQDASTISAASASSAKAIGITINGQQTAAGRTFTATASTRVAKLTSKEVNLAPPAAPVVSSTAAGSLATFTWPSVPNATSYIVKYNINGGDWITATENTTENSFKVSAYRGDSVTAKVTARNTTGSSVDTATNIKTQILPLWESCTFTSGWTNYLSGYTECGYTMTRHGVVLFKGHIKGGPTGNSAIFQLPQGYRPSYSLIFQTVMADHSSTRLQVNADGWVYAIGTSNTTYVGLDNIVFAPSQTLYRWTNLTLQNGWTNYGAPFAPLQTMVDGSGRVHTQGLVVQGTFTDRTPIAQLPSGSAPSEYHHVSARGEAYNLMGIASNGTLQAKGISSGYYSTQAMFYPASHTGWQNFGTVAGQPGDGQLGNGWTAYGGEFTTPAFTKAADGIVTLKGLIKGGVTTNLTYFGKLPAGYRPKFTQGYVIPGAGGPMRIDIGESGWLVVRQMNNTWASLDGISFLAEW